MACGTRLISSSWMTCSLLFKLNFGDEFIRSIKLLSGI